MILAEEMLRKKTGITINHRSFCDTHQCSHVFTGCKAFHFRDINKMSILIKSKYYILRTNFAFLLNNWKATQVAIFPTVLCIFSFHFCCLCSPVSFSLQIWDTSWKHSKNPILVHVTCFSIELSIYISICLPVDLSACHRERKRSLWSGPVQMQQLALYTKHLGLWLGRWLRWRLGRTPWVLL